MTLKNLDPNLSGSLLTAKRRSKEHGITVGTPLAVRGAALHVRLAYSEDQSRDYHGRFGEGGGDAKSADEKGGKVTAEEFGRSAGYWAMSAQSCDNTQAAADEYVANGHSDDQSKSVVAAEQIVDAMRDPEHVGHYEADTPLYRGMADRDGSIVESFREGEQVQFATASFAADAGLAQAFAQSASGPRAAEVVLRTEGPVTGANLDPDAPRIREIVAGGTFDVVSVETRPGPYGGDTTHTDITIRQTAVP